MIKLTYEQIVEKIKEKSGLSTEEIEAKINAKLEQLAGLISKDGAAHIVANEAGVNAFEAAPSGQVKIDKIMPGMRSVDIIGKVMAVYDIREFSTARGSGKVGSFMIADDTGRTRITCWHAMTDKMSEVKQDDVVKIVNGYAKDNQGRVEIHLNDKSDIEVNPEGETVSVSESAMAPQQPDYTRKKIADLQENDQNAEILGTVVQAFPPRFFEVCPECGKRARQREEQFVCDTHNAVTPDYSYVMNAIIDDGTETIRGVFFRQQADQLLKKTPEQMLELRKNPEDFDRINIELLGQMIKLGGKVTKNAMFDRLEIMARKVKMDPNPEEEIERANKEMGNETVSS